MMIRSLVAAALALALLTQIGHAQSGPTPPSDDILSRDAVLRDPEIPSAGNPKADIAVVEFFDFQCPYCRKVHADLQQLMKDDPQVRVVYKDWPILGEVS